MVSIKISTDFSRTPGAALPEQADYSGQEFRQQILSPKLKEAIDSNQKLKVFLDGTAGLGIAFLKESFGGLIKSDCIPYKIIIDRLKLVSDEDPDLIDEIYEILEAANESETRNMI